VADVAEPAPETAALPERLVTALLLTALQTPAGQQLWLGYALARDDLPWLQDETFRLVGCAAAVQHVPGGVVLQGEEFQPQGEGVRPQAQNGPAVPAARG